MDYQYYKYQLAKREIDKYNQAWAKLLMTLPVRYWINIKTHDVKTEYKFEGKWQTAEEIDIQFLELYKLTEHLCRQIKGDWK